MTCSFLEPSESLGNHAVCPWLVGGFFADAIFIKIIVDPGPRQREHELINILRRKSEWYDKGQISWILDSSFVVDFVVNPIPRQRL